MATTSDLARKTYVRTHCTMFAPKVVKLKLGWDTDISKDYTVITQEVETLLGEIRDIKNGPGFSKEDLPRLSEDF